MDQYACDDHDNHNVQDKLQFETVLQDGLKELRFTHDPKLLKQYFHKSIVKRGQRLQCLHAKILIDPTFKDDDLIL